MSISEKILELNNNNKQNIHLYFVNKQNENEFNTIKIDKEKSKNLKETLKTKTKNKVLSWNQTNTCFRNLTKNEKLYNNGTNEISFTINYPNNYISIDNNLIILENKDFADKSNFPSLEEYDSTINKAYEVYNFDNFDVVFVTQNNETIIYIDATNIKKENVKKFEEIFNLLK
jgi:hypothetical protein